MGAITGSARLRAKLNRKGDVGLGLKSGNSRKALKQKS